MWYQKSLVGGGELGMMIKTEHEYDHQYGTLYKQTLLFRKQFLLLSRQMIKNKELSILMQQTLFTLLKVEQKCLCFVESLNNTGL